VREEQKERRKGKRIPVNVRYINDNINHVRTQFISLHVDWTVHNRKSTVNKNTNEK
jgi:hypothetical protein